MFIVFYDKEKSYKRLKIIGIISVIIVTLIIIKVSIIPYFKYKVDSYKESQSIEKIDYEKAIAIKSAIHAIVEEELAQGKDVKLPVIELGDVNFSKSKEGTISYLIGQYYNENYPETYKGDHYSISITEEGKVIVTCLGVAIKTYLKTYDIQYCYRYGINLKDYVHINNAGVIKAVVERAVAESLAYGNTDVKLLETELNKENFKDCEVGSVSYYINEAILDTSMGYENFEESNGTSYEFCYLVSVSEKGDVLVRYPIYEHIMVE